MSTIWNKLCRACLASEETFVYLPLSDNVTAQMYYFCTSIKVQDDLPRTICNSCYELLVKFSEFKRTCIQSQNALLGLKCNVSDETDYMEPESVICGGHQNNETFKVKLENQCTNFTQNNLPLKEEEESDHCNDADDLLADIKCDDIVTIHTKNLKKRRKKKVASLKTQRIAKVKLKVARKHFTFTCDICNKKFNYLERFEAHKLEHEGKVAVIHCLPCNKTFMTWSGLRRHNQNEHTLVSLEKLKCNICGKICKSQQTLKMHKKMHGDRKMYVCDVCGKGCTTKFILKAHLDTHKENRERLFTCEHCGKKFYTNTILLSHVSRRHTARRFICQICSYPFTDKYNLAKHLLIHDGKKLYKCEVCNKEYGSRSSLVEHKRIHSGERPYLCSFCPKRFLSKRRVDDHHRVHTGERPHKCSVCDQGFTQRGTLKRHMKVHDRTMPVLN